MIKKPRKVLAMVLALSMLASVFVGTNAFADGDTFAAKDPIKTALTTSFYTKNSDGVRNSVSNTSDAVAGVKVYDADKNSVDVDKLIVGEKYTVELTLTQDENKANVYEIETAAKLLVKLNNDEESYIQDVTLTKDATVTDVAKYTAEFTAMTDSVNAVATTPKAGAMELVVDVVANASSTSWTAVSGYAYDANDDSHGEFVPVNKNFDGTEDAYFKFTSECDPVYEPHYFDGGVSLVCYNKNNEEVPITGAHKAEIVSLEKNGIGYDILYKVDKTALKSVLDDNTRIKSFSLKATAVKSTETKSIAYKTNDDWSFENDKKVVSAKPGELVTLTYKGAEEGKVFSGIAATQQAVAVANEGGTTPEPVLVAQMVNGKEVTFVMPNENITIDAAFKVQVELSNDTQDLTVSLVEKTSVTLTEGETTEILLKPSEGYKFVNELNIGGANSDKGYTFEYKGITEKGYLKLDAKIGSTATDKKVTDLSALYKDLLVEVNPEEVVVVPVCFDQAVEGTGAQAKANVLIKTFGTDGKLSTKGNNFVAVQYDNTKLKLTEAYLGKEELGVNNDYTDNYTGYIPIKDKVTKDVFTVKYSYLTGGIDVNINPENAGSVKVTDGTNSINRQEPDSYVYLTPQANDGYKFRSFAASYKNTDENKVDVTLKHYNGDTYYFQMPKVDESPYGPSVTVEATFEKDNAPITIKNNTPEADKATNNGYISVADSVALGETVNMQVLPNDGYVPNEIKVVAKKADQEVKSFDVKQNGSIHWGYSFDVPSDLDADSIEVSATFKEYTPAAEDGWAKTEDGNWTYTVNGKVVTGWKNDISGWEGQWFYFDANGIMLTSWQNNIPGWEGQWFYFDVNTGVMATGWQTNIPGWGANWFYFNTTTGTMLENQYTPDGYYVDANGCWVPNK